MGYMLFILTAIGVLAAPFVVAMLGVALMTGGTYYFATTLHKIMHPNVADRRLSELTPEQQEAVLESDKLADETYEKVKAYTANFDEKSKIAGLDDYKKFLDEVLKGAEVLPLKELPNESDPKKIKEESEKWIKGMEKVIGEEKFQTTEDKKAYMAGFNFMKDKYLEVLSGPEKKDDLNKELLKHAGARLSGAVHLSHDVTLA